MKLSELDTNMPLIDTNIMLSRDILAKYMGSINSSSNSDKTIYNPIFFPTAIIFGEIFNKYSLPDGTIHLSQKISFSKPIKQNSMVHAFAKINKNTIKAGKRIISIKIEITNNKKTILHESMCNLLVS